MNNRLQLKIKTLNELMWENRLPWSDVQRWLCQFAPTQGASQDEQLHALFLLSHFSYFNSTLMRVLLRALYRDLIQYPIIEKLRRRHHHTLDWQFLEPRYARSLKQLRFIGIGNPSESGTHLLYYFRQENKLSKDLFLHPHELFEGTAATPKFITGVKNIVFLDDFCGSGTQAERYSKNLLRRIRQLNANVRLSYFPLFATTAGIAHVRTETLFTDVDTPCELDESFRSLEERSRYFREENESVSREFAAAMCRRYGDLLEPSAPLGFGNCQLLLGFSHNIPNNSLPIFWSEGHGSRDWTPIFPRHKKGIGW